MSDYNLGVARGAIDINTTSLAKAGAQTAAFAKTTQSSLAATGAQMQKVGSGLTKYVTLPLIGLAILSVKAFNEQAKAEALVAQGIKTTGGAAHVTAAHASDLADSLQKTTTFADEVTLSAESMLLTFTNVRNEMGAGNDIFDQSIKLAQDLSIKFDTDLTNASKLVGKALQDPAHGLASLTRYGVTFTAQQKDQIKTLVANGDALTAQKLILKEIGVQVAGTAEAFAKTAEGKMKLALNSINNQLEGLGAIIVPLLASFLNFISGLVDGFVALPGPVKGVVGAFALLFAATGPVLSVGGKLVANWKSIRNGAADVVRGIGTMVTAIPKLVTWLAIEGTTATAGAAQLTLFGAAEAGAGVAGAAAAPGVAALSLATGVLLIALADLAGAAYLVKIAADINSFNKESESAEVRTAALAFNLEGLTSGTLADMKAAWAEQSGLLNDNADRMTAMGLAAKGLAANYAAGKISADTFNNGLLALGFTQEQVNAMIAAVPIPVYVDEMNAAGEATKKFAGLSVSEFEKWATSTKESIHSAILSLGTLDIRTDTTRKDMDKSFKLMLQNALRFDRDMKVLRKLHIGLNPRDESAFKKFLIDSGPATVDRFVSSSKKDQEKWGAEWVKASSHVKSAEDTVDRFSDTSSTNIAKTDDELVGFNDDWEWLRAHAATNLTVTTTYRTNGTPPPGGPGGPGGGGDHNPPPDDGPPGHPRTVTTGRLAAATDRRTSRSVGGVGRTAASSRGGRLIIEGTLDTPWGPSELRGLVVEEIEAETRYRGGLDRMNR